MEENRIKSLVQNGWRALILHPFFYNGIASAILLIEATALILLNFGKPLSAFGLINIGAFLAAIVGIALSIRRKGKSVVLYSSLSIAIFLPTINILFNGVDLRFSIWALPLAYLFELGAVCHALKSKSHGIFNVFLLVGLLLPMTQETIVIEKNAVGIQVVLVTIILFTALLFLILYSWHRTKSYLLINEKQLIDKIGAVIDSFSDILIKDDDVKKVLTNVAHRIIPGLEFEDCVIYLFDEDRQILRQVAAYGSKIESESNEIQNPIEIRIGKGIVGSVAQTGIPEIIADTTKDERYIQDDALRYSELCVPIIANNKVIGVIDSEHSSKKFFNEVHLYLMQIIADQCASKIAEIKYRAIHEQSVQLEMQSEHLKETNRIKSRFISNLSHDLKTPLTLILGPAKELRKHPLSENERDLVLNINSNGKQLKAIIDELLAVNEMNFLSQNKGNTPVNIKALLSRWMDNFEYRCKQKEIHVRVKGEEVSAIETDEKKLTSAIVHVLDYCLNHTAKNGAIKITYAIRNSTFIWKVETDRPEQPGDLETIEKDLSIVQQFANVMQGKLAIAIASSGGMLISLELPLKLTPEIAKKPTKEAPIVPEESNKPIVLVIEDHHDLRQFIQAALTDEFICVSSEDGEKGLEMARKFIPDLVITDLMLPGISGEQVCASIREDEQISHLPIVVLSAKSMPMDRVELYRLGAENYLTKPFEIEELQAIIRNNIQQRHNLKIAFQSKFMDGETVETVDPFIQKVIDVAEQHLHNDQFNISALTLELKIGRNQLQRKIKMLTNMTPVEFLRNIRLQKAYRMLESGEQTVSEVAFAVGFNNHSYFTRSFKNTFNQLPSQVEGANKANEHGIV